MQYLYSSELLVIQFYSCQKYELQLCVTLNEI